MHFFVSRAKFFLDFQILKSTLPILILNLFILILGESDSEENSSQDVPDSQNQQEARNNQTSFNLCCCSSNCCGSNQGMHL